MHTESATSLPVSVDRATKNARGRAATFFVEAHASHGARAVRDAAAAHLLPGEYLQADCVRKTSTPSVYLHEFAVFA